MAKNNGRYHRGFDEWSRRVYPYIICYPSEEDAQEAVPALARALGLSGQAVGAYIGQAQRNAGVYRLLLRMGYQDRDIPPWFKRPKHPVLMPIQVQAVPVDTRPPVYTLAESVKKDPPKSDLEILMSSLPENEIMWLSSQGTKIERNPDLSHYKIDTVHLYEGISNTQGVERRKAHPTPRQPTAEELRSQEEARKEKLRREAEERSQAEFRDWMTLYLYKVWLNSK